VKTAREQERVRGQRVDRAPERAETPAADIYPAYFQVILYMRSAYSCCIYSAYRTH
jgi:hypothetical protein